MPEYNLHVLGLNLSFATEVPAERLYRAVDFLNDRFTQLESRGQHLSKERLLIYLALSLANDYLQDKDKWSQLEEQLHQLVLRIDALESNKPITLEG